MKQMLDLLGSLAGASRDEIVDALSRCLPEYRSPKSAPPAHPQLRLVKPDLHVEAA
jgi:hypothetical protein